MKLDHSDTIETIIDDFHRQVLQHPDQLAVVCDNGRLNYSELNTRSDQLASHLRTEGVLSSSFVGVLLDRSLEMVVSLLAILKSGAAYLPLDPTYPVERLIYMINDACPILTLSQKRFANLLQDIDHKTLCLDTEWNNKVEVAKTESPCPVKAENLAYVIYTSGSTGNPKGVIIHHGALRSLVQAVSAQYEVVPTDRVLQFSSLSFDIAVEEIFTTLYAGATLVLRPNSLPSIREFHELIEREAITVLDLATPFWHEWVMALEESTIPIPPESLRLVIVGADTTAPERLASWHRIIKGRIRWMNTYGPTETTVTATVYEPKSAVSGDDQKVVAIGRPLTNTYVYILDEKLSPVSGGESGILYIGGEGVARGYLNQPDLTKERFIPDPFHPDSDARIYNSGDLVRYRHDGNLEFLGRQDNQIKIRGFRIEIGEVESLLRRQPKVKDAVVMPSKFALEDTRLVAYITVDSDQHIKLDELHAATQKTLPQYMRPVSYTILSSFPCTLNGKVDRNALPKPKISETEENDSLEKPLSDLEFQLKRVWKGVLQLNSVGFEDNFFELGGNSLSAVRLFARIEKVFGRILPLATLFDAPSIRELAKVMRDDGWKAPWQCLVPIKPSGSRTPFFCVHAVGGNVLSLRDLAHKLSTSRPFYALQSQGLNGKDQIPSSVQEMATYYLDEIRTVQENGPYLLGGQSSGGIIAFEMAKILHDRGEKVNLLAMIDSYPPPIYRLLDTLPFSRRFAFHLLNFRRRRFTYVFDRINQHVERAHQRIEQLFLSTMHRFGYYRNRPIPSPLRYRNVQAAINRAIDDYVPSEFSGEITLFRATESLEFFVDSNYDNHQNWQSFAQEGVVIHDIQGGHNLEKAPTVIELAAKVNTVLEAL